MHNQMCYFEIIFKGTALYFELKTVKIEYMILHDIRILIDIEKKYQVWHFDLTEKLTSKMNFQGCF